MKRLGWLAVAVMGLGCGDDDAEPQDAEPLDAAAEASTEDAGEGEDAAEEDAGEGEDAAEEDAAQAIDAAEEDAAEDIDAAEDAAVDATADAVVTEDCAIGSAASMATTGALDLFGMPSYFNEGEPLAAGHYRVTYLDGCMKYASDQGWTVNAYAGEPAAWFVIGESTSERFVVPPGTTGYAVGGGAFATFAECEAASLLVAPVEFDLPADGPVGVWLSDSNYGDNLAGEEGRNPRWRLDRDDDECATDGG